MYVKGVVTPPRQVISIAERDERRGGGERGEGEFAVILLNEFQRQIIISKYDLPGIS